MCFLNFYMARIVYNYAIIRILCIFVQNHMLCRVLSRVCKYWQTTTCSVFLTVFRGFLYIYAFLYIFVGF